MGNIVRPVEHDYFTVREEIYSLAGKYPFLRLGRIGKSVMGREIIALKIGKATEYVLIAAAFHGLERITSAVALRFAERLCDAVLYSGTVADISARKALTDRGVIIVPMVNPDGCEIAIHGEKACLDGCTKIKRLCGGHFEEWNANARGVDINHNFDAGWQNLRQIEEEAGIFGPGPRRYGGPHPESEPETVALTQLCTKVHMSHVIALHSQGEEIYWHYGDNTPDRSEHIAKVMSAVSGFTLAEPTELASHGGFKDWFIEKYGRPGFTVELGRGTNPLPARLLPDLYASAEELLMLSVII